MYYPVKQVTSGACAKTVHVLLHQLQAKVLFILEAQRRNVTTDKNNEPFLHSHASFSYLDKNGNIVLTGGHLKEARISYTGEIILNAAEEKIGRMMDPNAGIEVWKLS